MEGLLAGQAGGSGSGRLDGLCVDPEGVENPAGRVGEHLEHPDLAIEAAQHDLVQPATARVARQAAVVDVDLRVEPAFDAALEKGDHRRTGQTLVDVLHVEPGAAGERRLAQVIGGRPGVHVELEVTTGAVVELYEGGQNPGQTAIAAAGENGQGVGVEQMTLHQWRGQRQGQGGGDHVRRRHGPCTER